MSIYGIPVGAPASKDEIARTDLASDVQSSLDKADNSLSQDALQDGINTALAQAKESGEFDGEPGKNGSPGVYTGSEPPPEDAKVWVNPNGDAGEVVKSVNGEKPDKNGNVEIEVGGGAGGTAEWKLFGEVELTSDIARYSFTFDKAYSDVCIQYWGRTNDIEDTLTTGSSTALVRLNDLRSNIIKGSFSLQRTTWQGVVAIARLQHIGGNMMVGTFQNSGGGSEFTACNGVDATYDRGIENGYISLLDSCVFKAGGIFKVYVR